MVGSRLPGFAQPSVGQGPRRPYAGCVRVVSIAPLLRVGVSLAYIPLQSNTTWVPTLRHRMRYERKPIPRTQQPKPFKLSLSNLQSLTTHTYTLIPTLRAQPTQTLNSSNVFDRVLPRSPHQVVFHSNRRRLTESSAGSPLV